MSASQLFEFSASKYANAFPLDKHVAYCDLVESMEKVRGCGRTHSGGDTNGT